jgi:hypothetical protein
MNNLRTLPRRHRKIQCRYSYVSYFAIINFVFLLIMAAACTNKPSVEVPQVTSQGELEGIPPGAIKEEFADAPGMVRVLLSDNGGSKSADGTYMNGKKEGSWTEYYTNGVVKNITTYMAGEKEGIYAEMNNNGQLIKRFYYHKGQRHGDYKEFNYSNLKEERIYKFGKIEGTVKIYYDNAKVMEEGVYKNGLRDGISKWYDQDGKLTIEYEYKNGELVKK